MVNREEISSVIRSELEEFKKELIVEEVGNVVSTGDGVAMIYGLRQAMMSELLEFESGIHGLVFNLEDDLVGAVVLGDPETVKEGEKVKTTGRVVEVPVGEELLGRVVNPLGDPLDGKGLIRGDKKRNVEFNAPSVIDRQPVHEPLQTGIKAVDSMIPIGRGQRELIIGDRQTGKTAIAIDAILNQKGKGVYCIYVAIGQKTSTVAELISRLDERGAMEYTTVVMSSASDPASFQYLAPYAGCAIGEYYLYSGRHALIIYDDLSKHAVAYRELSLLLRRPPGREAYPGDIFYLHSRLLERASKLSNELGAGSLTALPIVETKEGDISAYIPTNVISITDGQIYLENDLFYRGQRPAINAGLSVSRVGGSAQIKAMKQVAGRLRLDLAQFRELQEFAQFSSELDKSSLAQLTRGEKLMEILKQKERQPLSVEEQVVSLYAGTKGFIDDMPTERLLDFENKMLQHIKTNKPDILNSIRDASEILPDIATRLDQVITSFKSVFLGG
ncbi:MAG: F0F1 ATP synthase subunit alpha [bacterium]